MKRKILKIFFENRKEQKAIVGLLKIYVIYISICTTLFILQKLTSLKRYLSFLSTTETEFPVFVFLIGFLIGMPILNSLKYVINTHPKKTALPLVIFILLASTSFIIILEVLFENYLPHFTNFLSNCTIYIIIAIGLFYLIRKKISKEKE